MSTAAQAPPICRHCGDKFDTMDELMSHDCAEAAIKRAVMGLIDNREEVYPDA